MKEVEEIREAERMRRRNFSESCSVLQSILPNIFPKVPVYVILYVYTIKSR